MASILKWLHKNSPALIFLMYTDMTTVKIQFNKIVLNEVEDSYALLEASYRLMAVWLR